MARRRTEHGVIAKKGPRTMSEMATRELVNEAILSEQNGRLFEAREKLERAIAEGGEASLGVDVRLRLGRICIRSLDYERAEQVLREARAMAESAGAPRQMAAAIHQLALLERRRFRYDEALALLEASPIVGLTGSPSSETGEWWHVRGMVLASRGDLADGERTLFRAYQVFQDLHDQEGLAAVGDSIAALLLKRGKVGGALQFALRSLDLKRRLNDRYGVAQSLNTVGRAYMLQTKGADAARAFSEGLEIAEGLQLLSSPRMGQMRNRLGQVALLEGDTGRASECFRKTLDSDPSPLNALYAHLGLAWVHIAAGRLDEAHAEGLNMERRLDGERGLSGMADLLTGVNGCIARRRGDVARGEQLLGQAVDRMGDTEMALDSIPYLYELRDLYYSDGRMDLAVRVMARALDLLHECGAERGILDLEAWLRRVDSPSLVQLALSQHLPDFLVGDILGGGLGSRPIRLQEAAVLFCDIRDYTSLSEGLHPGEVVEILNEWFGEAARVIRRHRGFVDKYIGDGLMALFGVPEARDDAAADAVRAALELREELWALNLRRRALGRGEIRAGIGIDTGEVVVGFIGSHHRRSYTVIGDTVNVASRIESATKDLRCDILISGATQSRQEPYRVAETLFRGNVPVKGRTQPVALFQVKGRLQDSP
jgi:class 3 adenylate cyclase